MLAVVPRAWVYLLQHSFVESERQCQCEWCAHINEFELAKAQSFKSFGIATVINYVQQTTKTFNNCLVIVAVAVPCLVSLYCLQLNHSYAVPFAYSSLFRSFGKYFSVIWPAHISIPLHWTMPNGQRISSAFGQCSMLCKYWWRHRSMSLYEAFNQVNWSLLIAFSVSLWLCIHWLWLRKCSRWANEDDEMTAMITAFQWMMLLNFRRSHSSQFELCMCVNSHRLIRFFCPTANHAHIIIIRLSE